MRNRRNPDRLSFPPTRSDVVMYVGAALIVDAGIERAWDALVAGTILLVVGLLVPRMKGPFSVGGPKAQFRGELVDPSPAEEEDGTTLASAGQPARLLAPEPPASSQPPSVRPR